VREVPRTGARLLLVHLDCAGVVGAGRESKVAKKQLRRTQKNVAKVARISLARK
jgi:hypothetical protein